MNEESQTQEGTAEVIDETSSAAEETENHETEDDTRFAALEGRIAALEAHRDGANETFEAHDLRLARLEREPETVAVSVEAGEGETISAPPGATVSEETTTTTTVDAPEGNETVQVTRRRYRRI